MKKTSASKSWSKENLPSELWPEILSRLPVKSLLRFRCVSKSWRSHVDDPSFFRVHHANSKNNQDETHLIVVQKPRNKKDKICVVRASNSFKTTTSVCSLDMGMLGDNWNVVCSSDGLFMLQYNTPTLMLMLWNPSIRRVRNLPPSPVILQGMRNVDLGFGFSPVISDYKHVRLVQSGKRSLHSIAIYTFGTGLWKTIEFKGKGISEWRWKFNYEENSMEFQRGSKTITGLKTVCFRGILYFIAAVSQSGGDEDLVSFDLNNEVFASTRLPSDDDWSNEFTSKALTLVDGGRSLGLIYLFSNQGCVWVLDDPEDDTYHRRRWTQHRLYIDCIDDCVDYDPDEWKESSILFVKKNGDLLLQWFYREVAAHNFETGEEKNILANNGRLIFSMVCGYIENLALLNG